MKIKKKKITIPAIFTHNYTSIHFIKAWPIQDKTIYTHDNPNDKKISLSVQK